MSDYFLTIKIATTLWYSHLRRLELRMNITMGRVTGSKREVYLSNIAIGGQSPSILSGYSLGLLYEVLGIAQWIGMVIL